MANNIFNITESGKLVSYEGFAKRVLIPEGVKTIGASAFENNIGIEVVVIPEGVTAINFWAFANCHALKKVVLPQSLKYIGMGAFKDCEKLCKINIPSSVEKMDAFCFLDCKSLGSVNIPQSMTEISDSAFECSGLVSLVIPSNIKHISQRAFMNCINLERVIFCNGIETIGNDAFTWTEITSLIFPKTLEEIGGCAFAHCEKLETLFMQNVHSIGVGAFAHCKKLRKITNHGKIEYVGDYAFCEAGKHYFEDIQPIKKNGKILSYKACQLTENGELRCKDKTYHIGRVSYTRRRLSSGFGIHSCLSPLYIFDFYNGYLGKDVEIIGIENLGNIEYRSYYLNVIASNRVKPYAKLTINDLFERFNEICNKQK